MVEDTGSKKKFKEDLKGHENVSTVSTPLYYTKPQDSRLIKGGFGAL